MDRRARGKAPRGQAVVEAALGTLVFVTVLVFAIHFAEVGYLSLKVQEASTSAVWDTTGEKMHDMNAMDFSPRLSAISTAGPNAQSRYAGFDGRSSQTGRSGITNALTRGASMQVTCARAGISAMTQTPKTVYPDTGGMECYSEARVSAFGFPKRFMDLGGRATFRQRNYAPLSYLKLCATEHANGQNGSCDGRFSVLLDDWGLTGPSEGTQCELQQSPCTNRGFWSLVDNVYNQAGGTTGAAMQMAQAIVGSSPINAGKFWTSLPVAGTGDTDPGTPYGDASPSPWHTNVGPASRNGAYASLSGMRGGCFLGLTCPPP